MRYPTHEEAHAAMMMMAEEDFEKRMRLPRFSILKHRGTEDYSVVRGNIDPENGVTEVVTVIGKDLPER